MIHKPLCMAWGNADDFKEVIKQLDLCEDSILDVYEEHLKEGVTRDKIKSFMAKEKWFSGAELAEYFDVLIDEKAAVAGIEAMENYYRSVGMPTSLCELGIHATEEQIKEMADKCSFYGKRTVGVMKKIGAPEAAEIYRMANDKSIPLYSR